MRNQLVQDEIFIGVDCHKETHYLVAINLKTDKKESFQFKNSNKGFKLCSNKLKKLEKRYKLSIGLEGSYGLGKHLAKHLINTGFEVFEVCSSLTKSRRNKTSGWDKSDEGDALIIAKIVRDDEHQLPKVLFDSGSEAIATISRRRDEFIKRRTADYNQLHAELLAYHPEYKEYGKLDRLYVQKYWLEYCEVQRTKEKNIEKKALLSSIIFLVQSIQYINQQVNKIEKEMDDYETEDTVNLQSMKGIGKVQAFKIISRIGDVDRFASSAKLASYSGNSPVDLSSGSSSITKMNRYGCRDLNCIFDQIALSALKHDELSTMYYEKKLLEGKSRKQARRYLARRIINIIYSLLKNKTKYNPKHKPLAKKIRKYKKTWNSSKVA